MEKDKLSERLREGFSMLRDDEPLPKGKTRLRPVNYGHADEDYNETLSEQSYFALNNKSGKWEKRTIRRRTS